MIRLTPDAIRCVHQWAQIITPDGMFTHRNGEIVFSHPDADFPRSIVIATRDAAFHEAETVAEAEAWLIQP